MRQSNHERKSPFLLWRRQTNLSINRAAVVLGKTRQTVMNMDRGMYRPTISTRKLMTAVAHGLKFEPWPV